MLNHAGVLEPPPNVQYDQHATKAVLAALWSEMRAMHTRGYLMRPGLLHSCGLHQAAEAIVEIPGEETDADNHEEVALYLIISFVVLGDKVSFEPSNRGMMLQELIPSSTG